jgi:serine/threonine protein phosphatase 1
MSDIHGCYDELMSMLKKINFTDDDQLIIAGDYVDRGQQSYEMLCWLENLPDNILFIKGNHDAEFAYNIELMNIAIKANNLNVDFENAEATGLVYDLTKQILLDNENGILFDYYGTLNELINKHQVTLKKLNEWKSIIDNMPYLFKIRINGKRYIIVHAGYIDERKLKGTKYNSLEDFYLYARDEAYEYGGADDTTIISGHTPTISKSNVSYNNGLVYKRVDKHCTYFNIDCGCAYKANQSNARLACIRLDDEKIFYVNGLQG